MGYDTYGVIDLMNMSHGIHGTYSGGVLLRAPLVPALFTGLIMS